MAQQPLPPLARFRFVDPQTGVPTQQAIQFLQQMFTALNTLTGQITIGTGSPNGAVTASPGAIYLNLSGGAATTLWVKESGSNTSSGWIGK